MFSLKFTIFFVAYISYYVNGEFYFASLANYGCSSNQRRVASILHDQANKTPFSLLVSPGDNFPSGVDFEHCFDKVYESKALQIPLFATMGQADWDNGSSAELIKENNEIYDSIKDIYPKFTFPNYYYHHVAHYTDTSSVLSRRDGTILFIFIDTFLLSSSFPDHKVTEEAFQVLNATLQYGDKHNDFTIVVGNKYLASSFSIDAMLRRVQQLIVDNNVELVISGNNRGTFNSTIGQTTFINCDSLCAFKVNGDILTPYTLYHNRLHEMKPIVTKLSMNVLSFQGVAGGELPSTTLIDLPFKKGAKHLSRDAFLKVVGTIGIMILLACLGSLALNHKR
ncbi:uncharacterized protein CMU_009750 [Cryptosporidium muris RN66]|uniref:Acid phosphatase n=1 Tax=Cryptosporidium muris (strain RN66) TaxID=441375 RepID=B6AE42_CRYMR|nr:uncharacterized protein CMU_009750 [Cryptosporidium muris RN66]EEA06483.1 hypothetical protein, conserved [Cryptosporidium muris RN66]|eukprot:XP_002140832.1 hypothetical protein [Cryptosporidium muris RN66]